VAGFISERWPTSNRNPRPACVGIRSRGERLQYFRHMVARNSEMIGDRRSADNRSAAFDEKKESSESKVCKIGHAHGGLA
jgi:hypothetical protein